MIHYIFDLDDTIIIHKNKPIHYKTITENNKLTELLSNLDGPCYIYTNGTGGHAINVLKKMNLIYLFDKIYSRDTIPSMKPSMNSFKIVQNNIQNRYNTNKDTFYFFDDLLENLQTANQLGWITYWINPNYEDGIHYSFVTMSFPTITDCLKYLEIK
jgi:FMN phosphatase YigB (HAD superfamily)